MFYSASSGGFYSAEIHGTAIPADAVAITAAEHAALLAAQSAGQRIVPDADGRPVAVDPPPPTEADLIARYSTAVQRTLDAQAVALGYDSIHTAVTYAGEPAVPAFQAEGQALRAWRSAVWATCYQVLSDVQAGSRPMPTEAELLAELPAFVAPA